MNNRKILVISSDSETVSTLKEALTSGGHRFGDSQLAPEPVTYKLDFASNGDEGFKKAINALSHDEPFALAYLDIFPDSNETKIETVSKIWQKIPTTQIILGLNPGALSFEDAIKVLGPTERLFFLRKPFSITEAQQLLMIMTANWNLNRLGDIPSLQKTIQKQTEELEKERSLRVNNSKLVALGEMAAGIAHEINTPLTNICINIGMLKEYSSAKDDDEQKGLLEKIEATSLRISQIIKGLRLFSRNADADPYEAIEMVEVIQETLNLCQQKFKSCGAKIIFDGTNSRVTVFGNQIKLMQVFLNLLSNAYDAIAAQKDKWVKIEVSKNQNDVCVSVTDSGLGLPLKVREHLFQPFYTTKPVGQGTGLGLSISKGIIEQHNGKISVDYDCKNTCFVISLPKMEAK